MAALSMPQTPKGRGAQKNKIGELKKPFNMHVNVLFKPAECEDPILCEVQFCLQEVFDLMHCDH